MIVDELERFLIIVPFIPAQVFIQITGGFAAFFIALDGGFGHIDAKFYFLFHLVNGVVGMGFDVKAGSLFFNHGIGFNADVFR